MNKWRRLIAEYLRYRKIDREYEIQINKRRKRMDQYLITRIVSRKIEHAKLITGVCTS